MISKERLLLMSGVIVQIYTNEDFSQMRENVVCMMNNLIPSTSITFFLAKTDGSCKCTDPICTGQFTEEGLYDYINNYQQKDHSRWLFTDGKSHIYRESDFFTPDVLSTSEYYKDIYVPERIKDTLQVAIAKNNTFLGVLTFFRREDEKDFTDDDLFLMQLLLEHLENRLYHELVEKRVEPEVSSSKPEPSIDETLEKDIAAKNHLTQREQEIFDLLIRGYSIDALKKHCYISESTLRKHIQNIYQKLNIHNRYELLKFRMDK